jgi:hypothetical protein
MDNSTVGGQNQTKAVSSPGLRAEAAVYFYAFNVALLMVVGKGYLAGVPTGTSWSGWVATLLAFTANFAMWAIVPLVPVLLTLLARRLWITLTTAVVLFTLLNLFVYADSIIYRLWRFHFNGMVLNLLTTPGAGDSVTAGSSTVLTTVMIIASILAAEVGLAVCACRLPGKWKFLPGIRTGKAITFSCLAFVALIVADKAVYDVGDLRSDTEIVRLRNLLPLYQTVTMKRFATRVLGLKIAPAPTLQLRGISGSLDYPKSPIRFRSSGPRPNILIVAIEGARFDMLTPTVMPFLSQWGATNLVCEENYSAGNTTRYGIFGLIYGLYGTYWQRAVAEHHGPVLVSALKELGYQFRILSCTDLNFPEFRQTAFLDVPGAITDSWTCPRVDRDRLMTDEFIKFVDEKRDPFFAFLFYDASHQPYHYPPAHAVFDVGNVTEDLNYIQLASNLSGMAHIKNRYKNSLHYTDAQIGRAIRALEERGLMDNTLIFICGDHGEEFGELGLFGHDSAFHRYQTQTLMVAHIPNEPPQQIQRMTSHIDIPPTILTYMGVENPLSDFTEGLPLTSKQVQPYTLIASWSDAAIVDRDAIITFGLEAYKADLTILNHDNVPLPNQRQALAARQAELLDALGSMRRFAK